MKQERKAITRKRIHFKAMHSGRVVLSILQVVACYLGIVFRCVQAVFWEVGWGWGQMCSAFFPLQNRGAGLWLVSWHCLGSFQEQV